MQTFLYITHSGDYMIVKYHIMILLSFETETVRLDMYIFFFSDCFVLYKWTPVIDHVCDIILNSGRVNVGQS